MRIQTGSEALSSKKFFNPRRNLGPENSRCGPKRNWEFLETKVGQKGFVTEGKKNCKLDFVTKEDVKMGFVGPFIY
jgi:hypothetical protein